MELLQDRQAEHYWDVLLPCLFYFFQELLLILRNMITEDGMASKSPNPELDEQVVLNFRAVKQLVQLVLL